MATRKRDRNFMETALSEMRASREEHTDKVDPLVGAVIVDANGNELSKAHRGKLREGDHAEYTLIERLLGSKNLEGSILYVTLEPCIVRTEGKIPCAKRILSARISKVFIGMPDPNPEIQGKGISYLINHNIVVDFFDFDLAEQIRNENKEFIAHWDSIARDEKFLPEVFEGPSEKEKKPVSSTTVNDFSQDMIAIYLTNRGISFKIPSPKLWEFFSKNGFTVFNQETRTYVPTIAGILLFGNQPQDSLVQSRISMEAYVTDKRITEEFKGPLLSFRDKIDSFFSKNIRKFTEIKAFDRLKVPEYPIEALREAVINAVAHRDYTEGARVIIQLFPDRIMIRSPGIPLRPLTLGKIRAYNAPPYSRNPRIALTFNYMNWMEEKGTGLIRMRDALLKHGLRPPEFSIDNGYFVVTIYGYEHAADRVRIAPEVLATLGDQQRVLLDAILRKGRITTSESAKLLKIDVSNARRRLSRLKEIGLVESKGSGPAIYYVLYEG